MERVGGDADHGRPAGVDRALVRLDDEPVRRRRLDPESDDARRRIGQRQRRQRRLQEVAAEGDRVWRHQFDSRRHLCPVWF